MARNLEDRVYEGADVMDSREIIERLEELRDSRPENMPAEPKDSDYPDGSWSEDDEEELNRLIALEDEVKASPDWKYGEALIRDSYFENYARDLAEDIGAVNRDATWPNNHIDWKAAAEALKADYFSVTYGNTEYWIRS